MKSAFWRSFAVVALVAMPAMANANDASIGSEVATNAMYGATLMNTTAVFNAFPHMVVDHGTGVELNTMGDGFGRVWWEAYDNTWLTMDVGRMDYGLSGTSFMWTGMASGLVFQGSPVFENYNMVNLGMARATSGGGSWAVGARLAPFGGSKFTGADPETENNATGYGFNASWGNGDGLDLGGEFAWTKLENITTPAAGAETKDESTDTGFGVNGRYTTDMYIYQASFLFANGSTKGDSFTDEQKTTDLGVYASAGRFLKNDVEGQATAEFGLGWVKDKYEEGDFKDENSAFFLPAVRVAAWEKISRRFGLMGGVGFAHAFGKETIDPAGTEDKNTGSVWDWSAGLFFQPTENVRIDARFQEANLDQVLSLGNQEPLVFYLGTTVGLN